MKCLKLGQGSQNRLKVFWHTFKNYLNAITIVNILIEFNNNDIIVLSLIYILIHKM